MHRIHFQVRSLVALFILAGIFLSGCSKMSKAERGKNAQAHYKLGIYYLNDNQTQPAFIEFQKAVEISPKDK
ncbi:MAG TPA: hypothetical protein VIL61_04265, partial [Nitrospiria bacterium]